MILLLTIFAWIVALPALLLALVFFLEVLASLGPARTRQYSSEQPSLVAIVPAHNEGKNILPTLKDLSAAMWDGARILVVADNCDDDTAAVAKSCGIDVLERSDPLRRGKGFALQYAIDHLRSAPPQCVAFFDADCRVSQDLPVKIATLAIEMQRPVQAGNIMLAPEGAGPRLAIAEFAWILINHVRMRGLSRWIDVTRFTGVGFAAPWAAISGFRFGSAEITEDQALTFAFAKRGIAPVFDPGVAVVSQFPEQSDDSVTQRARWEHGSLGVLHRHAAPGLLRGIASGNLQLIAIALDALIPPMALFAALLIAVLMIALIPAVVGAPGPLLAAAAATILFGGGLALAWLREGRKALPLSAVAGLAPYLLEKLSIYGKKGRQSSKSWTRTGRGSE